MSSSTPDSSPVTRRSPLHWRRNVLGLLLAAIVVIGVSPIGSHLVLHAARGPIAKAGWRMTVAEISGGLLSAVQLRGLHAEGGGSSAVADTVDVSVWRWSVDIRGLKARWQLADSSAHDAPAEIPAKQRDLSVPDYLPQIRVSRVRLDVVEGDEVRWRGQQLEAHWRPAVGIGGTGRLKLSTTGTLPTSTGPLTTRLDLTAALKDDRLRVQVKEVGIRHDTTMIRASGSMVLGMTGELPIEAALDFDMHPWIEETGDSDPIRDAAPVTELEGHVELAGPLRPLSLDAIVSFQGQMAGAGPLGGRFIARADSTVLQIDSLIASVAGGELSGRGELGFDGTASGQATLKEAEAGMILPSLGGQVEASVEYSSTPTTGATVDFVGTSAALAGLTPVAVDLRIEARIAGDSLTATAHSDILGMVEATGSSSGQGTFAVRGRLDAAPWVGSSVLVTVEGTATTSSFDLNLLAADLPFGADLGPLGVHLQLHSGHRLDVAAHAAGRQLVAAATLDLGSVRFDTLALSAQRLDLARWSPALGGALDGELRGRGPIDLGVDIRAGVQLDSLRVAGWHLQVPLDLSARITTGRLSVALKGEGVDLLVSADTDSIQGSAQIEGAQLLQGEDELFLRGRLQASATWSTLATPTLSMSVDSAAVTIAGLIARTTTTVVASLQSDQAELTETTLVTSLGDLRLEGSWNGGEGVMTAVIDSLDLAPWSGWEAAGGKAHVRVEGGLPMPRVAASVTARDLVFNEQSLGPLLVSTQLGGDGSTGRLILGDTVTPALVVELTTPIHLLDAAAHGDQMARWQIAARDYEARPLLFGATQDSSSVRISGQIDLSLPLSQLTGDLDWSQWTGSISIDRFRLLRSMGELKLADQVMAHLDEGSFSVEGLSLSLEVDRLDTTQTRLVGAAEMSGVVDRVDSDLRLRLRDIDIGSVAQLFELESGLAGLVSGEAVFTGTPSSPALDVEAAASLDELGLATLRIRGRPLGWNVLGKWRTPAEDELTASIGVPPDSVGWPDWANAKMRVRSDGIDLAALLDQWGELDDLEGRVQVELSVVDLIHPQVDGQINVEKLQMALLDMTPGYRFDAGEVRFDGSARGQLDGFVGTSTEGKGSLELSGEIRIQSILAPELEIHLLLDGVPFRYGDIFETPEVDADITWEQMADGNRLAGFLRLKKPLALIQVLDLEAPLPPPPAVRNRLLETTAMDLFIDIDELRTLSEISDVTLDGGVRLYGTLSKPRFQGEMNVTSGTLLLLNRSFTFDRGRIITDRLVPSFSILDIAYDPLLLDPELDMKATSNVRDTQADIDREVTFELRGTARSTAPVLTSSGLSDTEVLNLLAFGDPIGESRRDVLYTAGQLLLSRQVRKVGLDEFQLLSSGSVHGATIGKPSLRLGKYIDWPLPMWLRYEGLTKNMATGQLEAEYRITRLLKVDARTNSDRGVYGIGLVLEKDF